MGSDGEEWRRDLSVSVSVVVVLPTTHLEWLIASIRVRFAFTYCLIRSELVPLCICDCRSFAMYIFKIRDACFVDIFSQAQH